MAGLIAVAVSAAYRSHGLWRQRHDRLQRLHDLTREPVPDSVVEAGRQLVEHARTLLRADVAELLVPGDVAVAAGPRTVVATAAPVIADALLLLGDGDALTVRRRTRAADERALLARHGRRDLLLVRLHDDSGGLLLVADRLGDVGTFDRGDRQLLATFAHHAAVTLANARLVSRLRAEVAERAHETVHDVLTGLPNRLLLAERLQGALDERPVGTTLALLVIDLDHFKEVNDTLGHRTGDLVLQEIAQRLVDVVPPDQLVARLGGDEFAVLLTPADAVDAVVMGQRVQEALRRPLDVATMRLEVAGSVGVALAPEHGETPSALLQHADVAMYASKRAVTGVEVYDPGRDSRSPRRLDMVGRLRGAIEAGDLLMYYQPKAELRTGRVTGVEALARWRHPSFGFVPPDEFVPLAEQSGLVLPLTGFVLRTVLRQWRAWRDAGIELDVAVNMSMRALLDRSLPDRIGGLLGEYEVPPSMLRLEITEGTMMTDPRRAQEVLRQLSDMDVGLAVDDFGTGYSSLAYLKRLPVDELKIDRSFVATMATDDSDASIVRSTVELGHNLGLLVVAEGVEDRATWHRLAEFGCDLAQGHLLSRPVASADLQDWLRRYGQQGPLAPPASLRAVAAR